MRKIKKFKSLGFTFEQIRKLFPTYFDAAATATKVDENVIKEILQMYTNKEGGRTYIGKQLGLDQSVVGRILKKAEAQTIKKKSQKEPIILLDDIFSKLDKKNIEKILSLFKKNTQTIITHTDKINTEEINEININD